MAPSSREIALIELVLHELRTPLNVATGSLARLLNSGDGDLNAAQRTSAERASRACASLDTLGRQMRAWTQVDSTTTPGFATLGPVLEEAVAAAQGGLGRGLRLALAPVPTDLVVATRGGVLGPAIQSLVAAVARGATDGTTVSIAVSCGDKDRSVVQVAIGELGASSPDSGFPAEFTGGLGFALPLARAAIEASGGRVWSNEIGGHLAGIGVELRTDHLDGAPISRSACTTAPVLPSIE
jgi:signal transduction histidine kinase